jgi:WD40 repeat protein
MKCARSMWKNEEHAAWISWLDWSPDGQRIASASGDGTVRLWESQSGKLLLTNHGHEAGVTIAVWSPDGTRLASAGDDNAVHVWDSTNGKAFLVYREHHAWIRRALAWSPDGQRIVSGSWDKRVHVWDAISGNTLLIYQGHEGVVCSAAWSPDGKYIASGGAVPDDTVQIWDANTGEQLLTYREHPSSVHSLLWSKDSTQLVSAGPRSHARLWETNTGSTVGLYPHSDQIPLAWSPDWQSTIIASQDWLICQKLIPPPCLEPRGGKRLLWTYHATDHRAITALSWSPDGRFIALGGFGGMMEVWEIIPGQDEESLKKRYPGLKPEIFSSS